MIWVRTVAPSVTVRFKKNKTKQNKTKQKNEAWKTKIHKLDEIDAREGRLWTNL